MKRLTVLTAVLMLSALPVFVPSAHATAGPIRDLAVSGTGTTMYPAFAAGTTRYAVATTAATAGTVEVTATTSDPAGTVLVDGRPATGPTEVGGLSAGDEISVIIEDTAGRTAYAVVYLPAQFPALTATGGAGVQPGLIGLTLNKFDNSGTPAFEAIVDRNGVPTWVQQGSPKDLDLKRQPNAEITISRPTATPGMTGVALVTLGPDLSESARREMASPLTNTDGHDAERLPDGSTVLVGYEPNAITDKTDATIQKQGADGNVTFSWDSSALVGESVSTSADYAHINSIETVGTHHDILASFRHLSAVLLIATEAHDGYQPGDIIWKLGGRNSSFTFVNDDYPGGPCAQHAASELPNGDILLFDNGTDGLCVDPANPTGPTINRHQTRIAEYALDTTAHTATLVWEWKPAGRYAFFAGSARRMANGDTLVGWAADPTAIASEVDGSANPSLLWELKETNPGPVNFKAYRAEMLGDVPDEIAPTVTVTAPADGASIPQGAVVSPQALCRDRGGSTLQDCALPAGLDTSTPGPHTFHVTATDGNGNVTTVQRSYVVLPIVRAVDSAIRLQNETDWKGAGLVGSTVGQTERAAIPTRTGRVSATVLIRNTGNRQDTVGVFGYGSTRRFEVHYYAGRTDVTRRVLAGIYRSPVLAPGAASRLRVVVIRTAAASPGDQRRVLLRSTSLASATAIDRVALLVTARR